MFESHAGHAAEPLGTDKHCIPEEDLETHGGVRMRLSLANGLDVVVMAGFSNGTPSLRSEEAERKTLAAARWLMPNLPAELIVEALGLTQIRGNSINFDETE